MTTSIPLADAEGITPVSTQTAVIQPTEGARTEQRWIHAFASVISRCSRGFRINPDNTSGGWAPLDELVASGAAFAVHPDRRYLVVDLDVAGLSPAATMLRVAAFDRLEHAAASAGISRVVTNSGRPGHKHLILVLGSAASSVRDAIERQCREAGLDIRTRGVRPPLAPHRSGTSSTLSVCPADAYTALTVQVPDRSQVVQLAANLGLATLSRRMERVLREGHSAGGYESPSNGRMAFAIAAISSGYGREYIRTALLDPRNALGETFRARKSHWQDGEIERLWSLALSRQGAWSAPKISSRHEALGRVAIWNAALELDTWGGAAGGTDRAVCETLARLAHCQGGVDFSAGLSVVAVGSGVCEATARNSIKRIQKRGWLRVIEAHTPLTATRYRLTLPDLYRVAADRLDPLTPDAIDGATGLPIDRNQQGDLGTDVARWKALGKAAMLAWRALSGVKPISVESLAQALKVSHTAARLRLRKLERNGLAASFNGMWMRIGADLTILAEELGTSGAQERQARELVRRRRTRKTIRQLWSSAFRFMARSFTSEAKWSAETDLPNWITNTVPERVLVSWRARIRSPRYALTD